jgi:hypothetical protein
MGEAPFSSRHRINPKAHNTPIVTVATRAFAAPNFAEREEDLAGFFLLGFRVMIDHEIFPS